MTITFIHTAYCPDINVRWIDPAWGTVDARSPQPGGIDSVSFRGPIDFDLDCWMLCETNANPGVHPDYPDELRVNRVTEIVDHGDGTGTLRFARPITPGEASALHYSSTGSADAVLLLKALPGDVDGDGVVSSADILTLIDVLNGAAAPAWGNLSVDCDHSGVAGAADVLCVIDLLNAGWNGIEISGLPVQCP